MASMIPPIYYIHQFGRDVKDGAATSARDVVLLSKTKDKERWIAGIELRGEARDVLTIEDKDDIAELIRYRIEYRKRAKTDMKVIIQPIISVVGCGKNK